MQIAHKLRDGKAPRVFARAGAKPEILELPPAQYLSLAGVGAPEGTAFQDGIRAMYQVAYAIKSAFHKAGRGELRIPPLEALWTTREGGLPGTWTAPRWEWRWKLLLRMPQTVSAFDVDVARGTLAATHRGSLAASRVALERLAEHTVVQALHKGPYTTELETLAKMLEVMSQRHLRQHGLHHEIYLTNPCRTRPERLRTILRVPVA